ncbi:MAG TPA: hypothetical protein VND91_03825 [Candidatus Saccharimonadia bacterium]|nr:hypothetical protein [Candidatus Saccharimonadia bacterium]
MRPSAVELPAPVQRRFEPDPTVGSATVETSVPAVVYSSMNNGVAALVNADPPLPARNTTRLPAVNAAALFQAEKAVIAAQTAASRLIRTDIWYPQESE